MLTTILVAALNSRLFHPLLISEHCILFIQLALICMRLHPRYVIIGCLHDYMPVKTTFDKKSRLFQQACTCTLTLPVLFPPKLKQRLSCSLILSGGLRARQKLLILPFFIVVLCVTRTSFPSIIQCVVLYRCQLRCCANRNFNSIQLKMNSRKVGEQQ